MRFWSHFRVSTSIAYCIWDSLNVSPPQLRYENTTVSGQRKGSTQHAAYSHTPIELKPWVKFPAIVEAETNSAWAQQPAPTDLSAVFNNIVLGRVSKEEEVTNRTQSVLTYLGASLNLRPCPRWCP